MDQLTTAALGEYGVIVAALGLVVAYLFRSLQNSTSTRITELQNSANTRITELSASVADCLSKHEECEQRNDDCERRSAELSIRVAVLEHTVGVQQ